MIEDTKLGSLGFVLLVLTFFLILYLLPWIPKGRYLWQWVKAISTQHNLLHKISVAPSGKKLSIIIPVYNDGEKILLRTLETIQAHRQRDAKHEIEVIIVDGGCVDDTLRCLDSEKLTSLDIFLTTVAKGLSPGRGAAMITGATRAKGEYFMFLHCDTLLCQDFDAKVISQLSKDDVTLVTFSFKIASSSFQSNRSSWMEFNTNLRARYLWFPYGDQVLSVRRATYDSLGGFRIYPIMEDVDFVVRCRRYCLENQKYVLVLPDVAQCSGRRWEQVGVLKTTVLNYLFISGYMLFGLSPYTIFSWYYGR